MPIDQMAAYTQIQRLSALPYFGTLTTAAITELVKALSEESDTEVQAEGAISAILADGTRAANPETNRVPSPGEVRAWVRAEKEQEVRYDDPSPEPRFCGRTVPGWFYLGHDPKAEVTQAQLDGKVPLPPQVMLPSHCDRGWIHRTIWIPVKPARIDEDGNPVREPYHYSGKCRCQLGGTL